MSLQTWLPAQANPHVPVNENFDALEFAAVYAKNNLLSSGLTWAYYGGRWQGFSVVAGTLTLADGATNYIVVERATGIISVSSTITNWNNLADYARVYSVPTSGGAVTAASVQDHRAGDGGVFGSTGPVAPTAMDDLTDVDALAPSDGDLLVYDAATSRWVASPPGSAGGTLGKQSIYIAAGGMSPSASGGCAALATVASGANLPDIQSLDFDATTQEFAQFGFVMPKKWNRGTVTARFHWSHAATTVNFGVRWQLQAVAVSDDDPIGSAYGTAQAVNDTGGTTSDLYTTEETPAITVGGTPQPEDMVFFRVARVPADAADTMAIDARLHGVTLYITTDAETDA